MVNDNNLISQQDKAEEVKADASSDAALGQSNDESMDFGELYEQSLQNVQFGEIVTGKVIQITNDVVMVDVGWKTEGHIPIKELKDSEGNISLKVGDEIEILVDRRDAEGNLILSRDKAAKLKVWDDIKQAFDQNTLISGVIVERVKGGLSVDIGIQAFLPGSQVDIRPVRDLDKYVGQSMMFNILKYDRKRNNVVLSRRAILEAEREE
jgi:small subunit ribosomal protein S1